MMKIVKQFRRESQIKNSSMCVKTSEDRDFRCIAGRHYHVGAHLALVDDELVVASKCMAYSRMGDGILNIAVGRDRDPMAVAQDLKRAECQAHARKLHVSFCGGAQRGLTLRESTLSLYKRSVSCLFVSSR